MKKIMFIKSAVETDAVYDPIRSATHLGVWYLASLLKSKGHDIKYIDEVSRNNGSHKHKLFRRTINDNTGVDTPMDKSYEEFEAEKLQDFKNLSAKEFTKKYGTIRKEGSVSRIMVRTGNPIEETLLEIEKTNPEFIGIPLIATANYSSVVALGKAIKERFPEIKIIAGGQHISTEANEFSKENTWADFLVVGDAIGKINDIVEGKIKERIVRGGTVNFNEFPLLDPTIIEEENYRDGQNHTHTTSGRKAVDYMFTKGCFKDCEFCVAGTQGKKKVTTLNYDAVDEQLKLFKKNGIEELVVQDDAFIYKPEKHLKRILGLLKKHGFYWQNNGGIDFEMLTDEVTDMFIEYNRTGEGRLTSLYIPFNPRAWNKEKSAAGSMTEKFQNHYKNLKRLRLEGGINVLTSEIIGTPEHTMETMENDIELHKQMIREGYIDGVVTLSATLLPGTKWNMEGKKNIFHEKDYAGYSLFTVHNKTNHFPDPQVLEEFIVHRSKQLNKVQQTYSWYSAFPNATREEEEEREREREKIIERFYGEPIAHEQDAEISQATNTEKENLSGKRKFY